MNVERKKNHKKKQEDDQLLRKRRYNEQGDRRSTNQSSERNYSFKTPENNEPQNNLLRHESQPYIPDHKPELNYSHSYDGAKPNPPERPSGLSNLFSSAPERKKDEGDYLSSLLQTNFKGEGQNKYNGNKKFHK